MWAEFGPCMSKNNGLQSIQISGKALKALDDENIWDNDIAKECKTFAQNASENTCWR